MYPSQKATIFCPSTPCWASSADPEDFVHRGYHLESSTPSFADPETVGYDFCREAIQWYYENGCAGQPIAVEELEDFLVRDFHNLGVTPQTCAMRSLSVHIDLHPKNSRKYIEEHFAPLLALSLIPDFELRITVLDIVYYQIDIQYLWMINPSIKASIESFRAKGAKVCFEFFFQQELRSWHPPDLCMDPLFRHRIEGKMAEEMLEKDEDEWVEYLDEQKNGSKFGYTY
jgi:hypothetical protein